MSSTQHGQETPKTTPNIAEFDEQARRITDISELYVSTGIDPSKPIDAAEVRASDRRREVAEQLRRQMPVLIDASLRQEREAAEATAAELAEAQRQMDKKDSTQEDLGGGIQTLNRLGRVPRIKISR